LGEPSPPEDDAAAPRPIFRSLYPVKESVRYFPGPENLLASRQAVGESLPSRQRVMNFRVTARDNHMGGGGFSTTTTTVAVVMDSGPFALTQPGAAAVVWEVGSSQVVTWDVAGTSDAPVSCRNVKISLSVDGGKTFMPLGVNAPNTGMTAITAPDKPTTQARVMVEAIDNAFFSVSGADLQIVKR
jgi:hypothetical protein